MIEKEIRALLPMWTVAAAGLLAAAFDVYPLNTLGVPLYFIAVAALGAFSIGHELAYGTLGTALTLPVPRWRIWTSKLAVLLPMLAVLFVLADWRFTLNRGDRVFGSALFWLPAMGALFIAPWLTMLTRSPLAGTVFTIGIIGASMALGDWIGVALYGFTREVDAFRVAFLWWTLGILSLVGAVAGWRTFARLEVTGDRGADVQLLTARPAAAGSTAALRRRHPIAALVRKELRLQQLALVVSAIYIAACFGVLLSGASDRAVTLLSVFSTFYVVSLPVLIGSLAVGEEQQFGTHDTQLLMPMKASVLWAVKVSAAMLLSLMLAIAMPMLLTSLFPPQAPNLQVGLGMPKPQMFVIVLGFTSVSLYVSTLARSGLTALVYSIGAILGLGYFILRIGLQIAVETHTMVHARGDRWRAEWLYAGTPLWVVPLAGFVLLVVWLALRNYRYADRSARRVAWHAAIVAGCCVVCAIAFGALNAL